MNSGEILKKSESLCWKGLLALLVTVTAVAESGRAQVASNVVVWDTGSHLKDEAATQSRVGWKAVPSELFAFEPEPLKAASDPGYYGREYSFKGDTVVENRSFIAHFWSDKGQLVLYAKDTSAGGGSQGSSDASRKLWEFTPLHSKSQPGKIARCDILRNATDEVVIQAYFSGSPETSA